MLKKTIAVLCLWLIVSTAAILTRNAFVYIVCFLMFIAAVGTGLLILVASVLVRSLPGRFITRHNLSTSKLSFSVLCSFLFYLFFQVILYRFFLPSASDAISLTGNIILTMFAVYLAVRLLKPNKIKTILPAAVVFIAVTALLSFVNSLHPGSDDNIRDDPIQSLMTLGYVAWTSAEDNMEKIGVVHHEPELTYNGLNIYNSQHKPEAYLMDMNGKIVHKWAKALKGCTSWEDHVELTKTGNLLVVVQDRMLICLDWNSNVKWAKKMRVHHDISIAPDKKLYVLARDDDLIIRNGLPVPILNDSIVVLSQDKTILKKTFLYDIFKDHFKSETFINVYTGLFNAEHLLKIFYLKLLRNYSCNHGTSLDIMHTNSIEVLQRNIEGFCKKGDILICIRELDLIAVIDLQNESIVWQWGPGQISKPHHPTLLDNGNLLIFDNGRSSKASRVIELNPLTEQIEWEYKGKPGQKFYSPTRGSNQRLPNGNTLIAESDSGHVFEVTPDGKIVWEFYNLDLKADDKKRGTLYRMMRLVNREEYVLGLESP